MSGANGADKRDFDRSSSRLGAAGFLHRLVPRRLVYDPVDRRLDLRGGLSKILRHQMPSHFSWGHYLGGMVIFLFSIQAATGILLAFYYKPSIENAYASIQHLTNAVPFGFLVREIHAWTSELLLIAVLLHTCRVFFTCAYGKPREITWLTGAILLIATLTFAFTGYLLPWSQRAYWATRVGTEVIGWLPVIGHSLLILLRGGSDITGETITRFYVVHVLLLPWVMGVIVILHFALVWRLGLKGGEDTKAPIKQRLVYPNIVFNAIAIAYLTIGILTTLSILGPFSLGDPADPLVTPKSVKPEWYFLAFFQFIRYLPKALGASLVFIAGFLFFLWPFVPGVGGVCEARKRFTVRSIGVFCICSYLLLTGLGYISETDRMILGRRVHFDERGLPRRIQKESRERAGDISKGSIERAVDVEEGIENEGGRGEPMNDVSPRGDLGVVR